MNGGGAVDTAGADDIICNPGKGAAFTAGWSKNFVTSLPHSGFLHGYHNKALPAGAAPFEIVIRLNPANTAFFGADTEDMAYTVTSCQYYCPVYEITDNSMMEKYRQLVGAQGVNWIGQTYKTYIGSLVDAASTQTLQINDRSDSLLGLVTTVRTTARINDEEFSGLANTSIYGMTKYRYIIEGADFPSSGGVSLSVASGNTSDVARCYDQQSKTLAKPGKTHSDSLVTLTRYVKTAANGDAGIDSACSALCCDLKRFDDSRLSSVGLNTKQNASPNTLEVTTTADLNGVQTAVTFALVEAQWIMSNDGSLHVSM